MVRRTFYHMQRKSHKQVQSLKKIYIKTQRSIGTRQYSKFHILGGRGGCEGERSECGWMKHRERKGGERRGAGEGERKLSFWNRCKWYNNNNSDEGSKPEILSRTAQTTAALTSLKTVWNDSSKIRLMHSLDTFIFLYTCHGPSQESCKEEYEPWKWGTTHLTQRPCYQRGSPCQDPAGSRIFRRPPDHGKET